MFSLWDENDKCRPQLALRRPIPSALLHVLSERLALKLEEWSCCAVTRKGTAPFLLCAAFQTIRAPLRRLPPAV